MARDNHYLSVLGKSDETPQRFDGLLGFLSGWRCRVDPQEKPVPLDDMVSLNPSPEEVTVKPGDSLSLIAREHGYTLKALAQHNHIRNVSRIFPGQVIKLPVRAYYYPDDDPGPAPIASACARQCTLSFTFNDVIERPIDKLKVEIVSAAGEVYHSATDEMGKIQDYVLQTLDEISVWVSAGGNKVKEVTRFVPSFGKSNIIITSPKVRVKGQTAPIKDRPGSLDTDPQPINTVVSGRDSKGNPVIQINHTCPNKYDLNLGKNTVYWDAIIQASERSGIIPQSIAAVINAEAAKHRDGVWKAGSVCLDHAKIKEAQAHRKNIGAPTDGVAFYKSSAAGMTQFLNRTWLGETFRPGTHLNKTARKRGVIAERPKTDPYGHVIRHKSTFEPTLELMFEIAPNSWKTEKQIIADNYIRGQTPYPAKATPALSAWLNLRFEAEFAIMAAVDYGVSNLAALGRMGFAIAGLNDAEKAKVFYLTHHLGLGDAKRFINNTLPEEEAKRLLVAQVGGKRAFEDTQRHGNYVQAHRKWLTEFMDKFILLKDFFCNDTGCEKLVDSELFMVINKIRGG